ncbi:MAG: hypothetical protein FWD94_08920, partial [Treponema sp.]|nr:hypothetical protein [Treponema sp.]
MDFVLTKKTLSGDSSLSKSTPLQGTVSANLLRGTALFIILFQFRLLGGELADTSVYLAALLAGFGLPAFLLRRKLPGGFWGAVSVLAVVALVPWLARAFLAMPRLFLPGRTDGPAVAADALLLG